MVTKLKNSNCYKIKKLKIWQNWNCDKTQILKNPNCDKSQKLKWWQTRIVTNINLWKNKTLNRSFRKNFLTPWQQLRCSLGSVLQFETIGIRTQKMKLHGPIFIVDPSRCLSCLCPHTRHKANTFSNHWTKMSSTLWDSHQGTVLQSLLEAQSDNILISNEPTLLESMNGIVCREIHSIRENRRDNRGYLGRNALGLPLYWLSYQWIEDFLPCLNHGIVSTVIHS